MLSATDMPDALRLVSICRVFEAATSIFNVFETMLVLPFASVKAPAAIEIKAVPAVGPAAVYVTVREVPDVVRPESEPRVTFKSASSKSVTASLNVMVMLHVEPEV